MIPCSVVSSSSMALEAITMNLSLFQVTMSSVMMKIKRQFSASVEWMASLQ